MQPSHQAERCSCFQIAANKTRPSRGTQNPSGLWQAGENRGPFANFTVAKRAQIRLRRARRKALRRTLSGDSNRRTPAVSTHTLSSHCPFIRFIRTCPLLRSTLWPYTWGMRPRGEEGGAKSQVYRLLTVESELNWGLIFCSTSPPGPLSSWTWLLNFPMGHITNSKL